MGSRVCPSPHENTVIADDSPTYFHTVKISAVALVKMVSDIHL